MKGTWRALWRPTLVRRVFVSLLLSFVLVDAVLLAIDFVSYKRAMDDHPGLQQLALVLAPALGSLPERDAALVARSTLAQWNALRRRGGVLPGELAVQLRRREGDVVLASDALRGVALPARIAHLASIDVGGMRYWVSQADAGPWRLAVAEPAVSDGWMLGWLLNDLTGRVLLAFPLVLVPLWVTVVRGIRPLRDLARRLEQRDGGDLSPLSLDMRYAELQPLATAFDAMLARLRNHVRRERAFVQDAAHELRTPMAAIAAQAHVLARAPDAVQRRHAEEALDHALARTSHLSRQLLELATLDEVDARAPATVDIADLVQGTLAAAVPQASAHGIEVSLEAPDRLACALDWPVFQSVLNNLLDNAIRYGEAGGRVSVTLRVEGGVMTLLVADDGPGIAPASREHVFERFWRGAGHDVPGTGLGLAIVRQAVARMGGSVRIEDGLDGRGVAFRVEVPTAA
jgi:two-component system sensor histidine kinase QseC